MALTFPWDGRCTFPEVRPTEGSEIIAKTWASAAVVALATLLSACGGGKSNDDPLALSGKARTPCTQAIMDGHNHEGAGQPTPVAFLPSLKDCPSLAEWTAAANAFGIKLNGREAQFVDNTCNAETTGADVKGSQICKEAKAAVDDPRRVP